MGKKFLEEMDSTRGIDNNTVDTVDRRSVDTKKEKWTEMQDPDAGEQLCERVAAEVKSALPVKAESVEGDGVTVEDKFLMKFIERTIEVIERLMRPPSPPLPRPTQTAPNYPFIPFAAPAAAAAPPPVAKKQRLEDPQQPTAPPPQVTQPARPRPPETVQAAPKDPPKPATSLPKPVVKPVSNASPDHTPQSLVKEKDAMPTQPENIGVLPKEQPGMLTPKEVVQLAGYFRGKRELPEEPSLQLNILDFAGQKQYRPMHHCYIARRALYIVVFNIEDVLDHIDDDPCEPIEDIRYWVHSINAHIYPPDKNEKEKDKEIKKVLLVGTRRGNHTPEELQKIHDLIDLELMDPDSKCVNHISFESNYSFFPVENSTDYLKSETYLEDSGTKLLQQKIDNITAGLDFMQKLYPLKWLKFEQHLELRGKDARVPVIEIEEALKLAEDSRITDKEQQKWALEFFHETGKIICLGKLATYCCMIIIVLIFFCRSRSSSTALFGN